ncbi:MAG: acyltransferase domain-containing protein [bacterium]|nr:acyltransferase domain-containing protein [bacterium]
MDLETDLAHIHELDALEALRPHWQDSLATLPKDLPSFLTPAEIRTSRQWGGISPEADEALERTAHRIATNPVLLRLAWHGYRLAFTHKDYNGFRNWPGLIHALGNDAGTFYLLLCLAAIPQIRATHRARGIPEQITRHTCQDLHIGAQRYHAISNGHLGIEPFLLSWHRLIASGDLHRLGRMQYLVRPFGGKLRAFRHRSSGRVLALSEPGISFDAEGQIAREPDHPTVRTSHLLETPAEITGTPISSHGFALPKETTLSYAEWDCVLRPGDPVLEMHIPEGEPMTLEACHTSMQQALDFFPAYYPDRPFVAFACASWILNTQLEHMLSPTSNLVAYQRELYLFPRPYSGKDGLYFIFYQNDIDPTTAPRNTSLKRAVLDHLAAGHPLRNGGMFFLKEDMKHFGTQFYRQK